MTSAAVQSHFAVAGSLTGKRAPVEAWGKCLILVSLATWAASLAIGFQTAVAMLTFVGFGAAVLGLFRPPLGLLGVGMLCTLDAFSRHYVMTGGLLRWNTFNYLLLAVTVLYLPVVLRRRDIHTGLALAFVALLTIELAMAPQISSGSQTVLNILSFFGLLVFCQRGARQPLVWYWLGLLSGWVAAAGGLVFFLKRAELRAVTANSLAYFPLTALFAICLAMPAAAEKRRGQRVLAGLAAVNFCWVFLTGSRGSILVASIAMTYLVFQFRGQLHRKLFALAVCVLIGLPAVTLFSDLQQQTVGRIEKLFDSERTLANRTSGRSDLALGAWQIFMEHPLLGVGTGGFRRHWAAHRPREFRPRFGQQSEKEAHSGWARTLAENGFPGLLLHVAFVVSFAIVGRKKRHTELRSLGLMATCCLAAAFLATEFQPKGLWLLAAAVTVLLHNRRSAIVVGPRYAPAQPEFHVPYGEVAHGG